MPNKKNKKHSDVIEYAENLKSKTIKPTDHLKPIKQNNNDAGSNKKK